jgi:hypothetical protein
VRNTSERPFTIVDAMILIAATAVGLGVIRDWTAPVFTYVLRTHEVPSPSGLLMIAELTLVPILFYWTIAVVGIRLRRPRPSLRRLGRQPGLVACLAVILATLISFSIGRYPVLFSGKAQPGELSSLLMNLSPPHMVAPGVAVAWMVLAVSSRWRPDPGWIDRLGRSVGFAWLALLMILIVRTMLYAVGVIR